MIRMFILNFSWGTDEIKDGTGGCQLNVLDKESAHLLHLPFDPEACKGLIADLAKKGITEEQRRELAPLFTSGIIMPGNGDFKQGPQG